MYSKSEQKVKDEYIWECGHFSVCHRSCVCGCQCSSVD